MSSDSPAAILFDELGNPVGVEFDGVLYRLQVDSRITDGTSIVGVTNIAPGINALKVDVVKTVSGGGVGIGGTSSNFIAPFPDAGTAAGYFDGYYMQSAKVFDLDTLIGGTEFVLGTNLRTYADGGSVEAGTLTNPLRIDVTGTTIQPISGTVTADAGSGTFNIAGTVIANQGTSPWIVQVDGYVQTNPGVFVTNFPDNYLVTQGTSPWIDNIAQFGGVDISTGTGASGTGIPRVTVSNDSDILATQSGSWTVIANQGTNPWIVQDGAAETSLAAILDNQTNGSQQAIVDQGTNPWTDDVIDRSDRLLGVIYGSQGQQILQTPTNFNTQVEISVGATLIDPRQIRILTSDDIVTVTQFTDTNLLATVTQGPPNILANGWPVKITDGANILGTIANPLQINVDGYVQTNPDVFVTNFPSNYQVIQGTSPWVDNISQFGGNDVVTGTGVSGVGIPRVTVANDSNILATQSGTWTVAQGAPNSLGNAWPVEITDGSNILGTISHPIQVNVDGYVQTNPDVFVTNFPITQAVTQSTSPWVTDITQFGSNNVVTGTGTSGLGIPRVTVSSDSNILATQSGSWTVVANAGTGNFTVVQSSAANLNATVVGSVTANIGTTGGLALDSSVSGILVAQGSTTSGESGPLIQGAVTTAAPSYTTAKTSPLSLTTAGALRVDGSATTQPVQEVRSSSATETSVAASASSVILLASNANRLGATFWNDSTTATLYLKLGATASTTSYTAQLFPSGYYELPYGYTGEIDGIWSAAVGNARISELT